MTEIKRERAKVKTEDFQSPFYRVKDRFFEEITDADKEIYMTGFKRSKPVKKTLRWLTERALLKQFAPATVLVNALGNIFYIHGQTGLFLKPSPGYAGISNILKMSRAGLRRELTAALHKAAEKQEFVYVPGVRIKNNSDFISVNLTVKPLEKHSKESQAESLYLVILEQVSTISERISCDVGPGTELNEKYRSSLFQHELKDESELERELSRQKPKFKMSGERENLHEIQELKTDKAGLETSHDALKSFKYALAEIKRELAVIKTELQTTNDELYIANSKLQTTRNEIEISNDELASKNKELASVKTELKNTHNKLSAVKAELQDKLFNLSRINTIPSQFQGIYQLDNEGRYLRVDDHAPVNLFGRLPVAVADKRLDQVLGMDTSVPITLQEPSHCLTDDADLFILPKATTDLEFKNALAFNEVSAHGFRHDQDIRTVRIPEGVECVKRSMFFKCRQLETVILPSTLKQIDDFAFYGCENLKNLALENCKNLEKIGKSAFEGCAALVKISIPALTTEIQAAAFLGCKKIEKVDFSENSHLEILGSHAFKDCEGIKDLILPKALKYIGMSAFYGCRGLMHIVLPDELETIGEYVFWDCDSLKSIKVSNKRLLDQPGFSIGFPSDIEVKQGGGKP